MTLHRTDLKTKLDRYKLILAAGTRQHWSSEIVQVLSKHQLFSKYHASCISAIHMTSRDSLCFGRCCFLHMDLLNSLMIDLIFIPVSCKCYDNLNIN